jgi:hypothetical protein
MVEASGRWSRMVLPGSAWGRILDTGAEAGGGRTQLETGGCSPTHALPGDLPPPALLMNSVNDVCHPA